MLINERLRMLFYLYLPPTGCGEELSVQRTIPIFQVHQNRFHTSAPYGYGTEE